MTKQINSATEGLGSLFASMSPQELGTKTIQFSYRGLLLHFELNSSNQVVTIRRGTCSEIVSPMSRDYVIYNTILKNKLGAILDRI
jgi:hypothetical protein